MPIASYLAYPLEDKRLDLLVDLEAHPHCEVIPADNAEVFILVTDTPDPEAERTTQKYLKDHEGLMCLAMVYGEIGDTEQ